MKQKHVQEIIDCLGGSREKFYYHKDRYALMLLSYVVGSGMSIREIKQSKFKKLLDKPYVQKILQQKVYSVLTRERINAFWPKQCTCYLLTLDKWGTGGDWSRFGAQTSRSGWNLVLQLNFSAQHNRLYQRLVKPGQYHPFENACHPIAKNGGRHTLAWARIDLDLERDEALIEEIQTDWIRLALKSVKAAIAIESGVIRRPNYLPRYLNGLGCDAQALSRYVEEELKKHVEVWEEAMLASSIYLLREEIGIGKIYYHSFESGYTLKRISGKKPPRSLYTRLPARFCFEKTPEAPSFLTEKQNRKIVRTIKNGNFQFYKLTM